MRARSVSRQDNYLALVEVAKHRVEFTFAQAEGTLAGFFTRSFLVPERAGPAPAHFLSADLSEGGHLLTCGR